MIRAKTTDHESIRHQSVGIIGAGPAGLITGYTLLQDGFQNVQLLTCDKSAGGVWARGRVYPGVSINNVHGEFRFSPLPMPLPVFQEETGNRLCGEDMSAYMENFASMFLAGKIRFETEVLDVRRAGDDIGWEVDVFNLGTGNKEILSYAHIVLCTGGCSRALIPEALSEKSARQAGFRGPVAHSSEFALFVDQILGEVQANPDYSVVVIGGGKSAQDISAHLARHGTKVTVVFEKADAVLAYPIQLPDWFRKSRCLGIFSPHIELRTWLERFLHTTSLGRIITRGFWNLLTCVSFKVLKIPKDSPLRNAHSLFWGLRTNDEGTWRGDGFHALVHQGKIKLVAPTRVTGYAPDGESIVLQNGQTLVANAVILGTGFSSSWTDIFTERTLGELGMARRPPSKDVDEWAHYVTLSPPPVVRARGDQSTSSIYRGIVPAKNIARRDFAINGAVSTANNGYVYEVIAHWISSYFLGDDLRLPSTVEQALAERDRNAAWTRKRYPDVLTSANESNSSGLASWSWPQTVDELLDDMGAPSMRSGGNWLTWPFKVVSLDEITTLGQERRAIREMNGKK